MITCQNLHLDGVLLFESEIFKDSRGSFAETYKHADYLNFLPEDIRFIQDNESVSQYGVLRGLHFQNPPFEQSKLVRVSEGRIQDVIVDVRKNSSTFGQYISEILSKDNGRQIFIPKGFAHGFLTLSETAIVNYKVDNDYSQDNESGIRYNDQDLSINWELSLDNIIISDKDSKLPFLKDIK